MGNKLTPEQAIGNLKWIRIQCDSQLKQEIDRIIKYIESLSREAELGRVAVEARKSIGNMPKCISEWHEWSEFSDVECTPFVKYCKWRDFCRLYAGKEGGAGEL